MVQLYVRDVEAQLQRPEKELKGFAKVALEPGERKTVTLTLAREALAYFDDRAREWVAEAGTFEVLVGSFVARYSGAGPVPADRHGALAGLSGGTAESPRLKPGAASPQVRAVDARYLQD